MSAQSILNTMVKNIVGDVYISVYRLTVPTLVVLQTTQQDCVCSSARVTLTTSLTTPPEGVSCFAQEIPSLLLITQPGGVWMSVQKTQIFSEIFRL